jgi:PKD repeat protein
MQTDSLPSHLKVGDIMFCDIKPEILKKIEPIGLGLFFGMPGHANDHRAMYIGNNRFVEASPYRLRPLHMDVVGVVISPFWKIQLWATNFTYATVDTTQEIRDNAVEGAKTQRGRPYQFIVGGPNTDPNDETDCYADCWYCSELIWAAYWNNGVKFVVDNGIYSYNATSIWSFYDADNIILYENDDPYANAGGPYEGFVDDEISFNAYESYDPDGSIMKYNWSFGDGNTTFGEHPYHRYSKPGIYTVTLTVKDNGGKFATNMTTASISKKNQRPSDAIIYGHNSGYCSEIYNFSLYAIDPDDNMLEYTVYWDDGSSNTSGYLINGSYYNVSHQWIERGFYSIHVEVTDGKLTSSSYSYISIRTKDQIIDPITPASENSASLQDRFFDLRTSTRTSNNGCEHRFPISKNSFGHPFSNRLI